MTNVLVVYDRSSGRVLREQEYEGRRDALEARFAAEKEYRGRPSVEIVVLGASDREALRHSHGRYFLDFDALAARIA
ncbi:hypothetical protein ACQEU5_07815 [Marinactinospora thermotolerans]|uniref:Uncharacterized protein n=1 Tax=Marinactinospora thermotolerans DSM 45154 TaxID=1122192 RepID=A0A1T4R6W5_9ACTN|nr:hypothetical protein [Marinactinospora thermotolerans]SKA11669.1 hypothetical protein SAMN02745673_02568 [Marinactinospora thermotolerans DSM 45154]